MQLVVDEDAAQANSRLVGIRMTLMTLRLVENWRRDTDDFEASLILIAVVAILGERLTRGTQLPDDLKDLRHVFPDELLTQCNVSSIAAATGLNRETTRRKVNELVDAGLLVRSAGGMVTFVPGLMQLPSTWDLIRKQLDTVVRAINDLIRDGVIRAE